MPPTPSLHDPDHVVSIPASVLLETRDVAAAAFEVARQVERLIATVHSLTVRFDTHEAMVQPALEAHAAYVRALLAEKDALAAGGVTAVERARVAKVEGVTAVWAAVPMILRWALALGLGGGLGAAADRLLSTPTSEVSDDAVGR